MGIVMADLAVRYSFGQHVLAAVFNFGLDHIQGKSVFIIGL